MILDPMTHHAGFMIFVSVGAKNTVFPSPTEAYSERNIVTQLNLFGILYCRGVLNYVA